MQSLTLKTPPSVEPVNLHEAKDWANLDHDEFDFLINRRITSSRKQVESYIQRALNTQTYTYMLQSFKDIVLPMPPTQSVTHIKYIDTDGVQQTLAGSVYKLVLRNGRTHVVLDYDQEWPEYRSQEDPIEIEFIAGYGDDAADVPEPIQEAIMVMVTDAVENRQSEVIIPGAKFTQSIMAADNLLAPYRSWFAT